MVGGSFEGLLMARGAASAVNKLLSLFSPPNNESSNAISLFGALKIRLYCKKNQASYILIYVN